MARTMTDEQEKEHRHVASFGSDGAVGSDRLEAVLAELDAERDAHALTRASIKRCDVCGEECSTFEGHAMKDEISALKERLKRAEAVCEFMEARDLRMNDALAAWRAGK